MIEVISANRIFKTTSEPKRIQFVSELTVYYTNFGFQPGAEIIESKTKNQSVILVSARSLSSKLHVLMYENGDLLTGLEIWIEKKTDDRKSPYVITQC